MADASLAQEHLDEAVDLITLTTIPAIFYTCTFTLYCLSVRLSYAQLWDCNGKIKRQIACTLALQTVLLFFATLDIIIDNCHAQIVYIDSDLLGAPVGPPATLSFTILMRLASVVSIVEAFLITSVLLWRLWIIWGGTRFVMPLTIVSLFFHLASAGLGVSYYVITRKVDDLESVIIPQIGAIIFIIAALICLADLVFMTSAIIARLVFIRRKHIEVMGTDIANQYLGIVAMLVESYALDTIWNAGALISYGLNYTPTTNLFSNCATQIDILTESLLIYRVLSGRAWTRQTQDHLSTLRWASNGTGTTTSGTIDIRRASVPEEALPVVSVCESV